MGRLKGFFEFDGAIAESVGSNRPAQKPRSKKERKTQACGKPDQPPEASSPLPGMNGPEQGLEGLSSVKAQGISDVQNLAAVGINPDGGQRMAIIGF